MAETLEELEARRQTLLKTRESLVTRVTTGDRTVQYDLTDADAALRSLEARIAAARGETDTRQVRVYGRKGL